MSGSVAEEQIPATDNRPSIGKRIFGFVGGLTVLGGVVAASAAALGLIYAAAESDDVAATPPLTVATAEIAIQTSYLTSEAFVGRVEAARSTSLGFEAGGEVIEVLVDEGDFVLEGQLIARVDRAALEAQRDQLLAEIQRLRADLELAERTRARQDSLQDDGFASTQRADEARTAEQTLTAALAAINAELRFINIQISKTSISAPFSGVVAARRIDPGAIVGPGQTVVEILESGRPQARIGLPPERAEDLAPGELYTIEIRAHATPARLVALRPDLDPATRTVAAIFDLELATDGPRTLASTGASAAAAAPIVAPFGEVARLELPVAIDSRGAWVPLSALQEDAKGLWRILLLNENEDGEVIVGAGSVELIYVAGENAFVAGAFSEGDLYVPEGLNRIVIGDSVAIAADD